MSDENILILISIYAAYAIGTFIWILNCFIKYPEDDEFYEYYMQLSFIEKCFMTPMLFKLAAIVWILELLGIIEKSDE